MTTIAGDCASKPPANDPVASCLELNRRAAGVPIYQNGQHPLHADSHVPWRISPEPFCISRATHQYLRNLGTPLLRFYQAANKLYYESARGQRAPWLADYLDQGKPEGLVEFARMNRQKRLLPGVIRPDLIFTDEGRAIACELDSIPGGQGFVGSMAAEYGRLGFNVVGGSEGILEGFERMIRAQVPELERPVVAIVVSQEAMSYWNELEWLAQAMTSSGRLETLITRPEALRYVDGDFLLGETKIDVIYRYFELFDLKNIPKSELIMYAAKKQQVVVTPPFKAFSEEKMLFAFFHHPALQDYWRTELGKEAYAMLETLIPRTWILDPRSLPPHAVIPDLKIGDRAVCDWQELVQTTKRQRDYVLKPSGFSELAWGSRGVTFGGDISTEHWEERLKVALQSFPQTPYLLQEYHKPAKLQARYYDFERTMIRSFEGRARLCPYYYVEGDQAKLYGVLVTICPSDKRAIHGMVDSIMVPAMVEGAPV